MCTTPPTIDFYTAVDKCRLAVRRWHAAGSALARVIFLHGITSHSGWYEQCGERLAASGLDVHFLDRRGSGLNADQPGDVDCWQTWIADVAAYLNSCATVRAKAPDDNGRHYRPPVVLCGISWGGKLAAAVARRYPALIDGLALICPGLYSPYLPGPVRQIVLSLPARQRLQQRRVRIPLHRPELFTDNLPWREYIASDPLTLRRVTWRFAREDRRLTKYARQSATFMHTPALLMLAGRDRIVDNRRTREFFGRMGGSKTIVIEYPQAAHTLEFEAEPEPYFRDLVEWISRIVELVA
jgi:acylglycerol lipase